MMIRTVFLFAVVNWLFWFHGTAFCGDPSTHRSIKVTNCMQLQRIPIGCRWGHVRDAKLIHTLDAHIPRPAARVSMKNWEAFGLCLVRDSSDYQLHSCSWDVEYRGRLWIPGGSCIRIGFSLKYYGSFAGIFIVIIIIIIITDRWLITQLIECKLVCVVLSPIR